MQLMILLLVLYLLSILFGVVSIMSTFTLQLLMVSPTFLSS